MLAVRADGKILMGINGGHNGMESEQGVTNGSREK